MKKILFGLNQTSNTAIEESIREKHTDIVGESFEYKSEYYLAGIWKTLTEEDYDVLVLKEDLESASVTIDYLDDVTDKFPNLNIIFIINDEHHRDNYVKQLFNLGIYNILYKEELKISNIVELIQKNRSKMDAKIYLDIDEVESVDTETNLETINDRELETILYNLKLATLETISSIFDEISESYNDKQLLFLITILPKDIQELLLKSGNVNYEKYYKRWLILGNNISETEDNTTKERIKTKAKDSSVSLGKGFGIFSSNQDKVVIQEKVVVQERILGTISIGVGSVVNGSGSTHTALSIATYLKKLGNRVAVVEFNDNPKLRNLLIYGDKKDNLSCITYKGIDIYYQTGVKQDLIEFNKMLSMAKGNDYKYIILDLGVLKRINDKNVMEPSLSYHEMYRSDHQLLCLDGSYWNWYNINFYRSDDFANVEPSIGNWTSIINHSTDKSFKEIEKEIRKITVLKRIVQAPIYLDPFDLDEEEMEYLKDITKEYVSSEQVGKKRRKFLNFGKS